MNLFSLTDVSVCRPHSDFHYIYASGEKRQVWTLLLKMEQLTDSILIFFPRMLQERGLSSQPGLLERVLELKETHCSPYLLAFVFDCYEDALENNNQKENMREEEQKETLRKAVEVRVLIKKKNATLEIITTLSELCPNFCV